MIRHLIICVYISLLIAGTVPGSIEAQLQSQEQVVFLPLVTRSGEQTLSDELYQGLLASIRFNPAYRLTEPDQYESMLSGISVADLLASEYQMFEFCDRSNAGFLIGGVVTHTSEGTVKLDLIVFSHDDKRIISVHSETYENEDAVRSGIEALAQELSRRRHYMTTDISFMMSIVLPGLGQLQNRKPVHALVSAGLVAGSLIYWISADEADPFHFPNSDYSYNLDPVTEEYTYFYRNQEVLKTEFYALRGEDWEHFLTARAERRAVEVHKKRGLGLFCTAYLINVLDAVLFARRKIDPEPFFLSLKAQPPVQIGTTPRELRLRLVFNFR